MKTNGKTNGNILCSLTNAELSMCDPAVYKSFVSVGTSGILRVSSVFSQVPAKCEGVIIHNCRCDQWQNSFIQEGKWARPEEKYFPQEAINEQE